MFAVIFEVEPNVTKVDEYLDIAKTLKDQLEKIDGFISVERFQSLGDQEKLLSLSFWRDEAAILEWRKQVDHQQAQSKGYHNLFSNYRIRVAKIIRDYTMSDRNQAPQEPPAL